MCSLTVSMFLIQKLSIHGTWVLEKIANEPIIHYDLLEAIKEKEARELESYWSKFRIIRINNDVAEIVENV